MCSAVWRVLRFCRMVEVCRFWFVFISSFYRVRSVCGIGKWNFMGCGDKLSCVVVWGGGWMWCKIGRCTLVMMPSLSKNACAML